MNQFTSPAWGYWIGAVTIVSLIALFVFLRATARQTVFRDKQGKVIATTGHVWDDDLQEFNNPLPKWWMGLFILTLLFAVLYLILYPGLGFWGGLLGFTSDKMYQQESQAYEQRIAPIYAAYDKLDVAQLSKDPAAMATGQRMFLTYCAQCHGSDAGGSKGFPNLTVQGEKSFLYGNQPATLVQTITEGRMGMMPPMGQAVGGKDGVVAVANYVRSLSGLSHDATLAARGKALFAALYLVLYPGLGFWGGVLGFTSDRMYQQESQAYEQRIAPIYAAYDKLDVAQLSKDPAAMATGQRMFLTYCAQCHGSDAGGSKGFPNLTVHGERSFLYGNQPATLVQTITEGRMGMMPPMGQAVGGKDGVVAVANYVRSLSGLSHDAGLATRGKALFAANCAACHGADGTGNQMLGAPNLTDSNWLFGSSLQTIEQTIENGRNGHMPAQKGNLSADKIHVLAAYVYGLSHGAHVVAQ